MINTLSVATRGRLKNRSPLSMATLGYISSIITPAIFVPNNEFIWTLNKQNNTWTVWRRNDTWHIPKTNNTWTIKSRTTSWTLVPRRVLWTLFSEA